MTERVLNGNGDEAEEPRELDAAAPAEGQSRTDEPTAADLYDEGGVVTAGVVVGAPGAWGGGRRPALPHARSAGCRC